MFLFIVASSLQALDDGSGPFNPDDIFGFFPSQPAGPDQAEQSDQFDFNAAFDPDFLGEEYALTEDYSSLGSDLTEADYTLLGFDYPRDFDVTSDTGPLQMAHSEASQVSSSAEQAASSQKRKADEESYWS